MNEMTDKALGKLRLWGLSSLDMIELEQTLEDNNAEIEAVYFGNGISKDVARVYFNNGEMQIVKRYN